MTTENMLLRGDSVHQWYRIIMGFDWKLVQYVIEHLSIGPGDVVLDPFCGAGTTLVECKKQGIRSVGIDANPVCVLASRVKTSWRLDSEELTGWLDDILATSDQIEASGKVTSDTALNYLRESGMIDRGWLSLHKAQRVVAIRLAIEEANMSLGARKFFRLALISAIVSRIADIKFGPEVYCLPEPRRTGVRSSFVGVARMMIGDMESTKELGRTHASASVVLGDSRDKKVLRQAVPKGADYIITSPPYPAEHDYTRSTRLELVTLGHVKNIADLRGLKKRMVRCHTKGIYKDDSEGRHAVRYPAVRAISRELDRRAERRTDGFSRLYGRMVSEYFGGMLAHLGGAMQSLRPGGHCAYVIRDQKSLLGLYVDTPTVFANIATSRSQGFTLVDTIEWKKSRSSTGTRTLREKILIFRKPK